jgi:Mg2+ and Co2+ transporter CorA
MQEPDPKIVALVEPLMKQLFGFTEKQIEQHTKPLMQRIEALERRLAEVERRLASQGDVAEVG